MNKLLIFIGENQKFDVPSTVTAITSMSGTSAPSHADAIGAIFECEYAALGSKTIVRLSPDAETITAEGLDEASLSFALALQRALPVRLSAVDMAYTFHVALQDFHSVAELQQALSP